MKVNYVNNKDVQPFRNCAKLAKVEPVDHASLTVSETKSISFGNRIFSFPDAKPNFRGERAERPSVIRYAVGIQHARPGGPAFFRSLDFFLEISISESFQTTHSVSRQ